MHRFLSLLIVTGLTASVWAHGGRRLEIKINHDQLLVQGYNTGADDGAPSPRLHYNALHDHWANNPVVTAATATLPSYDLFDAGPLEGFDLTLTLTGASKWVSPPTMPAPDTTPDLVALDPADTIYLTFGTTTIDTAALGDLTLVSSVPADGAPHLDISYDIALHPADVLYVLELALSTDAPGIAASETIYTILSPDGPTMAERLHHAALYLEGYLGTPVLDGDANFDGLVNALDLSIVAANWLVTDADFGDGDFNLDDNVNALDLSTLAANWLAGASGGARFDAALGATGLGGVPEPSTISVLMAITAAAMTRRPRRGALGA